MTTDVPSAEPKKSLAAKLLRPKVAIPLLILFLILISPLLVRAWYLRGVPDFPEPFDPAPLLEDSVPDDQNAFTDYRKAVSLSTQPSAQLETLREQILEDGWQLATDDIRQFLRDNDDALRVWKQGTGKDKAVCIPASEYDSFLMLPCIESLLELQDSALLRCRKLEAEGQPQEAWEWYRAAIRASRHLGSQASIMERWYGASLFEQTAAGLERWAALPELTGPDLQTAIEQLQADWRLTEKTSVAVKIDNLSLVRTLEKADSSEAAAELLRQVGVEQPASLGLMIALGVEPELSLRLIRFDTWNQLKFCDLPRFERPKIIGTIALFDDPAGFQFDGIKWFRTDFEKTTQRSIFARMFLLNFSSHEIARFYDSLDREEARYRTLLVVLAGQAFERDRGRFPRTLDELVPEYLNEIPNDNYDGKPLKYRFDPAGPVVYTVFENLRDDGGLDWIQESLTSGRGPDDYGSQMQR